MKIFNKIRNRFKKTRFGKKPDFYTKDFQIKLAILNMRNVRISMVAYLSTLLFAFSIFFVDPSLVNAIDSVSKFTFIATNLIPVVITSALLIFIHKFNDYVREQYVLIRRVFTWVGVVGLTLIAYFCAFYSLKTSPMMFYVCIMYLIATSLYIHPLRKLLMFLLSYVVFLLSCIAYSIDASRIINATQSIIFTVFLATSISYILFENAVNNHKSTVELLQLNEKLQLANDKLVSLSETDFLTSLSNRRRFDTCLAIEWNKAMREGTCLSLCILDIDFFKNYNDYYGHVQGDKCLIAISKVLSSCIVRSYDCVARYGGEEFAIIIPNSSDGAMLAVCQRVIQNLAHNKIPHEKSAVSEFVTASFGFVCICPTKEYALEEFVQAADIALYVAKARGRNRVETIDFPLPKFSNI